jgi:D-sedoheptulose 7-phosphate isomerase
LKDYILSEMEASRQVMEAMAQDHDLIGQLEGGVRACVNCLLNEGRILIAGNGGSAADAQHIAGELVSRFAFERPGLPVLSLTTDTSVLTAIGNDDGFQYLFSRQLQAHGRKGDVFIAYSTSGTSHNIVRALEEAKRLGITSIGLTGQREGAMTVLCDFVLRTPSLVTPKIQEGHLVLGHILCGLVERAIFKEPG